MEKKHIVVVLDPAHGSNVSGKCSPDGVHKEYKWSRMICNLLEEALTNLGYKVYKTTSSIQEIGLSKRKTNANSIPISKDEVKFLLSPHNNAAGKDGKWHEATGVEIWTTPGKTLSDYFADYLFEGLKGWFADNVHRYRYNIDRPLDRDKEANFTVLMGNYAACLVEWLFQDSHEDVKLLSDPATNRKFVQAIVDGIELINYDLETKLNKVWKK